MARPAIVIQPYDPGWPDAYRAIATDLRAAAADAVVALHHIGSTAVPGLDAKDIIDIQLTVERLEDIDQGAMVAAGFILARPRSDHCPPGLKIPAAELAKRLYNHPARPANIHLREAGRFNQRYPLLCRDYLRTHPPAAAAYGEVKRQLAGRFPNDTESYYAIKDPVFDLIMAGAENWAASMGWSLPPSD